MQSTLDIPTEVKIMQPLLMPHQRQGLEIAKVNQKWGFFWDTGTGKTLLGIEIIRQKQVKTLVVCPLSVIESVWMEELTKWAPEIMAVNLWDAWKRRNNN